MSASPAAVDLLADLRGNYVERLRTRVASLTAFVGSCRQGILGNDAIDENHRCVHSMISSAALFGHPELSAAARIAERAFESRTGAETDNIINALEKLLLSANEVVDLYRSQDL